MTQISDPMLVHPDDKKNKNKTILYILQFGVMKLWK